MSSKPKKKTKKEASCRKTTKPSIDELFPEIFKEVAMKNYCYGEGYFIGRIYKEVCRILEIYDDEKRFMELFNKYNGVYYKLYGTQRGLQGFGKAPREPRLHNVWDIEFFK